MIAVTRGFAEAGKPEDFIRVVELYRHGLYLGSNYLMMDGSVSNRPPDRDGNGIDPWDVPAPSQFQGAGKASAPGPRPPSAKRIDVVSTLHGDERHDEYRWLERRDDPAVVAYLDAENAYATTYAEAIGVAPAVSDPAMAPV